MTTENDKPDEVVEMRIGKATNVRNLASAVARAVEGGKRVKLVAVGANAVSQAVKAAAKSNSYLGPRGKYAYFKIYFIDRPEAPEHAGNAAEADPADAVADDAGEGNGEQTTISAMVLETVFLRE